jgi:hypothetical protein
MNATTSTAKADQNPERTIAQLGWAAMNEAKN